MKAQISVSLIIGLFYLAIASWFDVAQANPRILVLPISNDLKTSADWFQQVKTLKSGERISFDCRNLKRRDYMSCPEGVYQFKRLEGNDKTGKYKLIITPITKKTTIDDKAHTKAGGRKQSTTVSAAKVRASSLHSTKINNQKKTKSSSAQLTSAEVTKAAKKKKVKIKIEVIKKQTKQPVSKGVSRSLSADK